MITFKHILFGTLFLLCLAMSCTSKKPVPLADQEKLLCDSLDIDFSVIQQLRTVNSNEIEPFHYSLSKSYQDGKEIEIDPILLKGLVFSEDNSKAYNTIFTLKDKFREKGYTIFLLENNFNIDNEPDRLAILKTTDKYSILNDIQTNGINYDIDTDSLITIIKQFDDKYSLELIGASGDWCEFIINGKVTDWKKLAQEVFEICPDVVYQGTGTIDVLANEMKKVKRIYLWWD